MSIIMGQLVDGVWHDQWYETKAHGGSFQREQAQMRHWITADGTAGPSGLEGFKAESGRYHLYVSLACPWAHRTLILRQLKNLTPHIGLSIVSPDMLTQGWTFDTSKNSSGDTLNHCNYLYELYLKNDPNYTGRVTVPVLWDTKTQHIVNNESSEIILMFNDAFNELTHNHTNYYPQELKEDIDTMNAFIYDTINNGVYRCGFATTQEAYEEAYHQLFNALDKLEQLLAQQRYLIDNTITLADWRLFTTLIRFDAVYYGHFKCNKKRLEDYPNLAHYLRELYQWPGVAQTVDMQQIKRHYYFSHTMINPTQIVPIGPEIDYFRPYNRGQ